MRLLDQFVQDGDRLFRWRSYLPLVLLPVVIAAGAFVFDAMQERARAGAWSVDGLWAWFFAASAVLFLVFAALKRGTRLFEE